MLIHCADLTSMMDMLIKKERDLYTHIIASAEKEKMFLYRIHDCGYENPFDLGGILTFPGGSLSVGMEIKYLDNVAQINHANLMSPKQQQWIGTYNECRSLGILFVQIKTELFARMYLPSIAEIVEQRISFGKCAIVDRTKSYKYSGFVTVLNLLTE